MSRVLIVGAGGVGGVVAHKCAQLREVFDEVILASRTLARCEKIKAQIKEAVTGSPGAFGTTRITAGSTPYRATTSSAVNRETQITRSADRAARGVTHRYFAPVFREKSLG